MRKISEEEKEKGRQLLIRKKNSNESSRNNVFYWLIKPPIDIVIRQTMKLILAVYYKIEYDGEIEWYGSSCSSCYSS